MVVATRQIQGRQIRNIECIDTGSTDSGSDAGESQSVSKVRVFGIVVRDADRPRRIRVDSRQGVGARTTGNAFHSNEPTRNQCRRGPVETVRCIPHCQRDINAG